MLKSFGCSICQRQAPKKLRAHGKFSERMAWLRHHYRDKHPERFKAMYKKAAKTKTKAR